VLAVVAALATSLHRDGHTWGDDFTLYLRQAKGLVDGNVGQVIADNHFNVDNVCWENDYPHSDSSWPDSPEHLEQLFAGIDDATVDRLIDALDGLCQAPLERVELDLSAVGYLGSAGVRALAQAADNPAGVPVQVVGASDIVRRVLALTGVDRLLAAGPSVSGSR